MDIIKFFHTNLFKSGTITATSEHVNFPKENLQHRDFNKMWQSNHGAGSGWGSFGIYATNNKINFHEGGGELTGTLTFGWYSADTLCTEIKDAMDDAAGSAETYTVEYLEGTNKFKISATGAFTILWQTGTNSATSVGTIIGFDVTANNTGADNYTADYVRTHSEEIVSCDFGGIKDIYGVMIRGHNFSSSAIVRVEFSIDNFATASESIDFIMQDNILVLEWDIPKTYQDCRIWIRDWENPDLYVAMGVPYMGGQFQPETNFMGDGSIDRQDPSNVLPSENGQESSIQLDHFNVWAYTFHVKGLTEKGYFDALFDAMGNSKAFFYCEDPDLPLTTTKYVAINSFGWSGRRDVGLYTLSMQLREQR